jgi:hypothetical protein
MSDDVCAICGDEERHHCHNGGTRIENYFTIGRGQDELDAAREWHGRAVAAEAEVAAVIGERDAARAALGEDLEAAGAYSLALAELPGIMAERDEWKARALAAEEQAATAEARFARRACDEIHALNVECDQLQEQLQQAREIIGSLTGTVIGEPISGEFLAAYNAASRFLTETDPVVSTSGNPDTTTTEPSE